MKATNPIHPERTAYVMARYWLNRYRRLPRWRFLARRKALIRAEAWAKTDASYKSRTESQE